MDLMYLLAEELDGGDVREEVGSMVGFELDGDLTKAASGDLPFRRNAVEHRSPVQILSPDQRHYRRRRRETETNGG